MIAGAPYRYIYSIQLNQYNWRLGAPAGDVFVSVPVLYAELLCT